MAVHEADLVVLGGGSGGYAAALRAAELGSSVVIVEKDQKSASTYRSVAGASARP